MNGRPAALLLLALLAAPGTASARTWVVAADGTGDFRKLSEACAACSSGDTISVMPGEYHETDHDDGDDGSIMFEAKQVAIIGLSQGTEVSLQEKLGFSNCPGPVVLSNLRFHDVPNPITIWGHGVYFIRNCRFENSICPPYSATGGAINDLDATLTVEDCYFVGNVLTAEDGGGGAIAGYGPVGALTVRRSVFVNNRATYGGAIDCLGLTSEDCLFSRNTGRYGAALRVGYDSHVTNCTFYKNRCEGEVNGAIYFFDEQGICPDHCIFAQTENGFGVVCWDGAATARCCDFWANDHNDNPGLWCSLSADDGNFAEDPLFCDAEGGDFGLQAGSPCLPGQHGGFDCGRIGSGTETCGLVPIRNVTWGRIKLGFK